MFRRILTGPILIFALVLVVLAASPTATHAADRGDSDCSGTTDGKDALAILTAMSGAAQTVPQNCLAIGEIRGGAVNGDANCDRRIDVPDVIETLQLVAGVPVPPCYATALTSSGTVSATIGPEGSTLSTTGPDGSTYSLQVPPNALTGPQLIEMTPLASVSSLPFSGGFAVGVDLQPSGLLFWEPVTLTITPSQAISLDQETAFEISDGILSLAPVMPQTGAVQITMTHFTSSGIANGSSAERLLVTGKGPAAKYENDIARITHDERENGANAQPLTDKATAYYNAEIQPNLQRAATDCAFGKTFLPKAISWARQLSILGGGDDFSTQIQTVMQAYINNLVACFNDAATRCQGHDLSGVPDMLTYARMLAILGGGSLVDDTKPAKCAHFRLTFDSELCLSYVHMAPGGCANQIDVQFATDSIDWGGITSAEPQAQGPLSLIKAVGPAQSATSSGSTFMIVGGGIYLNQIDDAGAVQKARVSVIIQPGKPIEHWTTSSGSFDAFRWYNRFCAIHTAELLGAPNPGILTCTTGDIGAGNARFKIRDWKLVGGELYAEKSFDRTYAGVSTAGSDAEPQGGPPPYGWERTHLKLYHEPQ